MNLLPRLAWPAVLLGGAGGLLAQRAVLVKRAIPLGNDETTYSLMAWSWTGRLSRPVAVAPHRFRGVGALLTPAVAVSDRIWVHRAAFALLGLALLFATYLIGSRFLGRWVAAFAAALFGASWLHVYFSVQLLPDVPAALGVAGVLLLYWRTVPVEPERPLRRLWMVGASLGVVFYLNPGQAFLAGLVVVADLALHHRRSLVSWETIRAGAALGIVLLPHFVRVWIDHGSPIALLRVSLGTSDQLGGPLPGGNPGYVDYANWFLDSSRMFGKPLGVAILIGVGLVAIAAIRGWPIPRRDARLLGLWLLLPSLGMALLFHAEERYLFVSYPAAFLAAGVLLRAISDWRQRIARYAVAAAALGALVAFGVTQHTVVSDRVDRQIKNESFVHVAAMALAERAEPPCLAFVRYRSQFTFRTPCDIYAYTPELEPVLERAQAFRGDVFFVSFERGRSHPDYMPEVLRSAEASLEMVVPGRTFLGAALIHRRAAEPSS